METTSLAETLTGAQRTNEQLGVALKALRIATNALGDIALRGADERTAERALTEIAAVTDDV